VSDTRTVRRTDRWLAVALTILATLLAIAALRSYRAAGVPQSFYQQNFAPAVMIACGRGFVMPEMTVPLQAFLQLREDTFDCASLPSTLQVSSVEWNAGWVYLYRTSGLLWRMTGVSWSALDWLVAVMCGVTAAALYGIFRLAARPWIAALVVLMVIASPGNLMHLLSLRDYSKAPFALAATLMLALLVVARRGVLSMIALAAAAGAVIGVGWGFRGDLVILAPFGILVLLTLPPAPFRQRLIATAAMLVALVATAFPVVAGMAESGCQFHLALLGLTTPLVNALGMAPAPYQFSDHFLDASVSVRVSDFSQRVLGVPAGVLCSPSYESAAGQLYFSLAAIFPSDLVAHAYGSVLSILRDGIDLGLNSQAPRPFAATAWIAALFEGGRWLLGAVSRIGPLLFLGAVGAIWVREKRLAVAFAVFTLFLAGYPAIEFEERHWFHLRFLPWLSLLVIAGSGFVSWSSQQWRQAMFAAAMLLVVLAAPLIVLRWVQSQSVRELIAAYQSAASQPLAVQHQPDFVKVTWPIDATVAADGFSADLLAVTFDAAACDGVAPIAITARYESESSSHDFSTSMHIERPIGERQQRLFVPVFRVAERDRVLGRFSGFSVSGAPSTCIASVDRIVDRQSPPVWLQVQVPADLASAGLYHSIRRPRMLTW